MVWLPVNLAILPELPPLVVTPPPLPAQLPVLRQIVALAAPGSGSV